MFTDISWSCTCWPVASVLRIYDVAFGGRHLRIYRTRIYRTRSLDLLLVDLQRTSQFFFYSSFFFMAIFRFTGVPLGNLVQRLFFFIYTYIVFRVVGVWGSGAILHIRCSTLSQHKGCVKWKLTLPEMIFFFFFPELT